MKIDNYYVNIFVSSIKGSNVLKLNKEKKEVYSEAYKFNYETYDSSGRIIRNEFSTYDEKI